MDITKPCKPYGSNWPDDRAVWVDLRAAPVPLPYGRDQRVSLILLFISHFFLRKGFEESLNHDTERKSKCPVIDMIGKFICGHANSI